MAGCFTAPGGDRAGLNGPSAQLAGARVPSYAQRRLETTGVVRIGGVGAGRVGSPARALADAEATPARALRPATSERPMLPAHGLHDQEPALARGHGGQVRLLRDAGGPLRAR